MKDPKYLVFNPVHNGFKEVPMVYKICPYLNMFNEIQHERRLAPIVNYMKVEDKTNPEDYKIVLRGTPGSPCAPPKGPGGPRDLKNVT